MQCGSATKSSKIRYSGIAETTGYPYPLKLIVRFSFSVITTKLWDSNYSEYQEYLYNRTPTKLNSDSKISLPPRHRKSDGTYSSTISPYLPKSEGKNMGDFWNEEIVRTAVANQNLDIDGEHIAPFPKQIITLPILQTSEIGDLVLDPFCGSGNVGKVCDVLERNFVGYDLNNYIS